MTPNNEKRCPEFVNPPTVETVLGVQFEPIRGFRSHHYGWFWREYLNAKGFRNVSDERLLPTYVEAFDVPKLNLTKAENPEDKLGIRMKARSEDRSRTLQLQPNKLYLSWNRLNSEAPRYATVKPQFTELVADLNSFAASAGLGPLQPNLWEVQYVNQIPSGELWEEPRDWHRVLPTLFPQVDPSITGLRFATYSGEWHFEIEPKLGRVHVRVAKMIANHLEAPVLYLSLIARGEIGPNGSPDLATGMDLGHDACIRLFLELTSPAAHHAWGLK